ncbi:MAG: hypothetical protein GY868_09480 [Deltaproteobacteria bacterium]|nr:hypothetical protein [Deltaproteobacteria bacterium]
MTATSDTLQELYRTILSENTAIKQGLSEIFEQADDHRQLKVLDTIDTIFHRLDQLELWGKERVASWSQYYRCVNDFLQSIVRFDPNRELSRKLTEQLQTYTAEPWFLKLIRPVRFKTLKEINLVTEKQRVTRILLDHNEDTENDERKQYNQLLHTSLYGGLSRSLQSSLRDYLLPQDNTLLSSIQDMEQNLPTCRRTRATIRRYQSVRGVIQGVYQNGLDMFSSAFFANRLTAEQYLKKALDVRNERRTNRAQWESLSAKIIETKTEMFEQEDVYRRAAVGLDTASKKLEIARSALDVASEIDSKQNERSKQQKAAEKAQTQYSALKEQEKENQAQNQVLTNRQLELACKLSNAGEAWEAYPDRSDCINRSANSWQKPGNCWTTKRYLLETLMNGWKTSSSSFQKHRPLTSQLIASGRKPT